MHLNKPKQYNFERHETQHDSKSMLLNNKRSFDGSKKYYINMLDKIYNCQTKCQCKNSNKIKITGSNNKCVENKQISENTIKKYGSRVDNHYYQQNDRKDDEKKDKETQRKTYLLEEEEKCFLKSAPSLK